jgi:hypothetical protein
MLYPNPGVESKPSSSTPGSLRFLPAAAFVLLLVVVFGDPLLTGRNFSGRDLVPYGLPMEKSVHDAWSRGRVPVWSTDISGGRPILPNPNTGTLYPVRPLFGLLPFPAAMRLFPVLHWAIAGLGMLALLDALSVSAPAAWVGAATFVFSGVSISQVFYQPFGAAVAFHPWLLWALVRRGPTGRKAVRLALVWGLLFLLGDVFAAAIALFAAALWIGLGVERGGRARELLTLGLGLGLAALLAAPQIVATALLVPETQRAITAIPLREVLLFTLSPWRLLEILVPYPFGQIWTLEDHFVWARGTLNCFYATLYCGAFALVGLAAVARAGQRATRFCVALFGSGVALAIAGSFVPAAWRGGASPVPLRYPEKFAVMITFALALAAGLAFDRLRRGNGAARWALGVAAVLAVGAAGAALFPGTVASAAVAALGAPPVVLPDAAEELPGALAEGGLLWVATWAAVTLLRGSGRPARAAAVVLLTAIPIAANRRIAVTEHPASLFAPTALARAIARRDPAGAYRTIDEAMYRAPSPLQLEGDRASPWGTELTRRRWGYHVQTLWGRGTVFNLDVDRGDLSRVDSLRKIVAREAASPEAESLFSSLSLRFGVRFRDQAPLGGFHPFGGDAFMGWDENPSALPDIRLVGRWREAPDALAALGELTRLAADEVVLESGRSARGVARPGLVRVVERSPERLSLVTSGPDPAWLFVLRAFWGHRSVRLDGIPVETVPAQLAFTAVRVPAGEHVIEWREEIPGFAVSRWGPPLFAAIAAALWFSARTPVAARP